MMWGSDLDGVAMLAKARHADMLADAMRRQQLHQLLPGRAYKHNLWRWLRVVVLGQLLQERPVEPYATQRSLQHS